MLYICKKKNKVKRKSRYAIYYMSNSRKHKAKGKFNNGL